MGFFHTIFLFDGFRSVRASLFGNTLRGGAPAGAGERIATPVCGLARNDRLFSTACVTAKGRDTSLYTREALCRGAAAAYGAMWASPPTEGSCRGIRGDAPQGYLFRFAPLRGHRPLRRGARGAFIQRLSLRQRFAPPPSQMEARGVPRLRARGTDSHASDIGHWLGMTPLRGVRGGQGRPPLRSNARGAVQNRNLGIAFWRGTWYNGGKEYRERSFLYVGYF